LTHFGESEGCCAGAWLPAVGVLLRCRRGGVPGCGALSAGERRRKTLPFPLRIRYAEAIGTGVLVTRGLRVSERTYFALLNDPCRLVEP